MVLDSGAGVTTATAVVGGVKVGANVCKIELGGDDLTSYMAGLIRALCCGSEMSADLKRALSPTC